MSRASTSFAVLMLHLESELLARIIGQNSYKALDKSDIILLE